MVRHRRSRGWPLGSGRVARQVLPGLRTRVILVMGAGIVDWQITCRYERAVGQAGIGAKRDQKGGSVGGGAGSRSRAEKSFAL